MHLIELDATGWRRPEHFYRALLPALGAPNWHGHNLDAINDSIFEGGINAVEPPFRIVVTGTSHVNEKMQEFLRKVAGLFDAARAETGREAYIEFKPSL